MNVQDVVALRVNPKTLVRVHDIDKHGIAAVELLEAPGLTFKVLSEDLVECGLTEPGNELEGSVNILGTQYKIRIIEESDRCSECGDGLTDFSTKEIKLLRLKQEPMSMADLKKYQKLVLRHEIIHAFLFESGLNSSSHLAGAFALDEELVDWIAIQSPKIWRAFKEAGCDE